MAGSPHDHDQRRLTLSRDARLAALAKIDPDQQPRAAGLTARAWAAVRTICEAIELATTRDGCYLHIETLATKCRMSRRTFLRSAAIGRRAGAFNSADQYDDRGRAASCWWVCWDRLSVWAGENTLDDREPHRGPPSSPGRLVPPVAPTVPRLALTVHEMALTPPQLAPTPRASERALKKSPKGISNTTQIYNPPPCLPILNTDDGRALLASTADATTHEAGDWGRLEVFLFGLGIDRAAAACRVAREQGLRVVELEQLVAHWQTHAGGKPYAAWGAGALCHRLQNARPGMPAERGWPQVSAAWSRHVADRAAAAKRAAERNAEPVEQFTGSIVAEFQRLKREKARA